MTAINNSFQQFLVDLLECQEAIDAVDPINLCIAEREALRSIIATCKTIVQENSGTDEHDEFEEDMK